MLSRIGLCPIGALSNKSGAWSFLTIWMNHLKHAQCGCGLFHGFLCCITTDMAQPTYKNLIKLLDEAESDENSTAEVLAAMFHETYPHISVGRPARLLETVRRIAGPIQNGRVKGAARTLYLKRTWTPRIRNTAPKGGMICL